MLSAKSGKHHSEPSTGKGELLISLSLAVVKGKFWQHGRNKMLPGYAATITVKVSSLSLILSSGGY